MPRKAVSVANQPTRVQQVPVHLPVLHVKQQEVFNCKSRFRVLRCGRRWGKSFLGVVEAFAVAIPGGRVWWIAPSYPVANVGWRIIRNLGSQIPGARIREADRMVELPGQGSVQVRSADNPDSLRGESLSLAILDECAFMDERAWTEAIRPALSDQKGRALFISTPSGKNWFWGLFQHATDDTTGEWAAFHFSSYDNPHIDPQEIDSARAGLPERVYLQEYMAEFLEDGAVFRKVEEAATGTVQYKATEGHSYVIGCDWGKHDDYTVFAVIDRTGHELCYLERSNKVNFSLQVGRLKALADRFANPLIVSEANAAQNIISEEAWKLDLRLREFVTTNASKTDAVESLIVAFEQNKLQIIPDSVLLGELRAFGVERLPSGRMRYSAPRGFHDDTVMALCLAWDAAKHDAPGEPVQRAATVTKEIKYPVATKRRMLAWR